MNFMDRVAQLREMSFQSPKHPRRPPLPRGEVTSAVARAYADALEAYENGAADFKIARAEHDRKVKEFRDSIITDAVNLWVDDGHKEEAVRVVWRHAEENSDSTMTSTYEDFTDLMAVISEFVKKNA